MTSTFAQTRMAASRPNRHYPLGNTDAEHERLIRQAARLAPLTERLFREAGIGAGQLILDLGSGVGDVAMLAARLAGSSGEVVGVERDPRSVARASARLAEAGLYNVRFLQSDADQIASSSMCREAFEHSAANPELADFQSASSEGTTMNQHLFAFALARASVHAAGYLTECKTVFMGGSDLLLQLVEYSVGEPEATKRKAS